jgi:hypothetical protein
VSADLRREYRRVVGEYDRLRHEHGLLRIENRRLTTELRVERAERATETRERRLRIDAFYEATTLAEKLNVIDRFLAWSDPCYRRDHLQWPRPPA